VLLAEIANRADAGVIAAKMLDALATPFSTDGHVLQLSASFGISVFPDDGEDLETLVERADVAMYRSKRQNPGSFQYFSPLDYDVGAPRHSQPDRPPADLAPRNHADLREANQNLVLAALDAEEQHARAREAHLRQIKFLAMVAHELRNPLAPIRIAAELLERARADGALLDRLRMVIHRQVGHMARLVEDLLGGALEAPGGFRIESVDMDLTSTLAMAIEACEPGFRSRRQNFVSQASIGKLPVRGDSDRLAQVFINLLENASKYTPEGGHVSLTVTTKGGEVQIAVVDDGMGILPELLPTIFDMFARDPRARKLRPDGVGIGLAVVRELVTAHHGSITAASAGPGLGSRFVVTLPLSVSIPEGPCPTESASN
jgi:signal transduction histidine kinase